MKSLNKITLIGNVGSEPELRSTNGGDILSFSLATSETYKERETTQWHRISVFGKLATAIQPYIEKGSQLYVEGQMVYEEWTDKDGNKRNTPRVKVGFGGNVIMLGGKGKGGGSRREAQRTTVETSTGPVEVGGALDDDIPF
jgi:single-strand DNA-binding protein